MEALPPSAVGAGGEATAAALPAIEMRGITRAFGQNIACDRIDLTVFAGRITGLLGENGAGKSTLMRVLVGLSQPDEGAILIEGKEVAIRSPQVAASFGLAMLHQESSLIDTLTVWENVALGEGGRVKPADVRRRVRAAGDLYGLSVDADTQVRQLTAGMRQRVELIKCMSREPRVIILDEPTSFLTIAESRDLFAVLRRVVQEERRAVVLISHKLDEILTATDEVVVLRRGQVVARHRSRETTARQLARDMIGREVSDGVEAVSLGVLGVGGAPDPPEEPAESRPIVLSLNGLRAGGTQNVPTLDGVTLDVYLGEIIGLTGIEGNGQVALQDVLASLLPLTAGTVEVGGQRVRAGSPGLMQRAGISVITEDRHRSGCVPDMSVAENLVLGDVARYCRFALLDRRRIRRHAVDLIERFDIRTPSPDAPMHTLSGGNQQRVVLAREISRSPLVLVAAQVTRGLDVGAIAYVNACIRDAAAQGVGVILISSELQELMAMSDRIAVIHRGRIVAQMPCRDVDPERIAMLMGGAAA